MKSYQPLTPLAGAVDGDDVRASGVLGLVHDCAGV